MNPLNELINQIEIQELWEPEIVLKRNDHIIRRIITGPHN